MKYRLSKSSTREYELMVNWFRADTSRIQKHGLFLEEIFTELSKNPSNDSVVGDLISLVLNFLNKNPSQIKSNMPIVNGIYFKSSDPNTWSIKLEDTIKDFFNKYREECGLTGYNVNKTRINK